MATSLPANTTRYVQRHPSARASSVIAAVASSPRPRSRNSFRVPIDDRYVAPSDLRDSIERREQRDRLAQPAVEGARVIRPVDRIDTVPERLPVEGIMEQDRVAEVADLPSGKGVDAGLVALQESKNLGVDA